MNRVKVKIGNQPETEYFIIRNRTDLEELCGMITEAGNNLVKRLINSSTPVDRWDHLRYGGFEGALLSQLIVKMRMIEIRPLIEPLILAQQRCEVLSGYVLDDGETILVNDNMGWCPLTDDIEILDEWVWLEDMTVYYELHPNDKYINLENDEALEDRTISRFAKMGQSFSYITRLHKFNKAELTEIFRRFKANGGTVVYVYTTASNVKQMYEYFEAAMDAGLRNFEFEWSAEPPYAVEDFLRHAKREAKVTVLNDEL